MSSWRPLAIAVSAATGRVYVSDQDSNAVFIFSRDLVVPAVSTGLASNVAPSSATLNGTVNPDGTTLTDCHFDYGTDTSYAAGSVPCQDGSGNSVVGNTSSSPVAVHADVSGLTAGQSYHFRLVASNSDGTSDGADQVFGPPAVSLTGASQLTPTGATVAATVNPQNLDTTCLFEYGTDTSYSAGSVPCTPADLGSGDSGVPASASLSGLSPATTYHFRVVASNASGATDGPDETFATTPPALIDVQPPTGMSDSSGLSTGNAALNVYIDPQGSDTSYHFEYGTTTGYGSSTPVADAGPGSTPSLRSAPISGLQASTTYHYRTVVSNSYGSFAGPDSTFTTPPASCPNQAFRGGPGATLPDCRAFEQVSPEDKANNPVSLQDIAPSGDRVTFASVGAFAGALSDVTGADYLAVRGGTGWATQALDPPAGLGYGTAGAEIASPDLSQFATLLFNGHSILGSTAATAYLRTPAGAFTSASPTISPTAGGQFSSEVTIDGGDGSLSHLVFTATEPLLASDTGPAFAGRLYDLAQNPGGAPTIQPVNVDNAGNFLPSCNDAGAKLAQGDDGADPRTVSADGSTIVFDEPDPESNCSSSSGGKALFARVGGQRTVELSDPAPNNECTTQACQAAPAPTADGADLAGVSTDGSKVFFTSPRQLTDTASEDANSNDLSCQQATGDSGCNLYAYDFDRPAGRNLVDVSGGDTSGLGPRVLGVVKSSDDGSHVYYVAEGVLSSEPNQLGQSAQAGALNLYAYDMQTGTTAFIGDLCSGSGQSGTVTGVGSCPGPGSDVQSGDAVEQLFGAKSDLTPDGRYLTFSTYAQLTPDDTNQAADVYEYDAQTGSLVRVSVGHDGQDQNGNGGTGDAAARPPEVTGQDTLDLAQHVISSDGQTIVFSTARPLQAGADNGQPDVYEWHQGEVSLVSGAQSANPITTAEIGPSGQDIVFATDQALVPSDTDGLRDVYDARIDGGFPAAAVSPAPCSGDACQGSPSSAPPPPAAASVTFSGPGNATAGSPPGSARVLTRTVHGATFLVKVNVPSAGLITITGAGVRTVHKSVSHAGTYALRVTLTQKARAMLARSHRLGLRLRVGYAPPGASAQATIVRVPVLPAVTRRTNHARRATSSTHGGAR